MRTHDHNDGGQAGPASVDITGETEEQAGGLDSTVRTRLQWLAEAAAALEAAARVGCLDRERGAAPVCQQRRAAMRGQCLLDQFQRLLLVQSP